VRLRSARIALPLWILSAAQTQRERSEAAAKSSEVVVLSLLARELDAFLIHLPLRDGEDRVEHVLTKFVADALLERVARVSVPHAVLDDVVQDARYHGLLILSIPRENHRDAGGLREIGETCSAPHFRS
jgi:hypothetical protein